MRQVVIETRQRDSSSKSSQHRLNHHNYTPKSAPTPVSNNPAPTPSSAASSQRAFAPLSPQNPPTTRGSSVNITGASIDNLNKPASCSQSKTRQENSPKHTVTSQRTESPDARGRVFSIRQIYPPYPITTHSKPHAKTGSSRFLFDTIFCYAFVLYVAKKSIFLPL